MLSASKLYAASYTIKIYKQQSNGAEDGGGGGPIKIVIYQR